MNVVEKISRDKLIAIIRGFGPDDAMQIAKALHAGGINILEVTMNSTQPLKTIEQIASEMGDQVVVGAGTVLDSESTRAAIAAGAEFIISPILDVETIKITKRYGKVSIPAALTPTEILQAFTEGGDIVKVFPAATLGPDYIKHLRGPMPQLKLLPTGGINLDNVDEFLQKGAAGVGLGGSLVNQTDQVTEDYLQKMTYKAEQFVAKVQNS
ncbi:MAG TPA: bifunctional 4-hydroxy-2-oxoglutarate aldolase/2-dehydro-3-deoxy-phosphogluconate aldolase [Bacillota bacterium]|nr:bifunctional 4-hydroxy-2-oxoglutarate aldolase/2-dehydro-3-deoxy-phosphogluconate aldolase [Bacillota bacterium]